jgi:hypothetical protein
MTSDILPRELQRTPIGKRHGSACLTMRIRTLEMKVLSGKLRLKSYARTSLTNKPFLPA